jgi:predicted nucleic acid-binding protein
MAAALVDTFIIVDILRGYPPAVTWFNAQPDLAVCRAVWLEVLEGVIDSHNQRAAVVRLRRLQLEELITQDFVWATQ